MPALHQTPRQVRLYFRGELLQSQLLWPGQPVTVGRQPRDHTFVLPCPELPWRVELISPLDDGWIVRAQTSWRITLDDSPDSSPLMEDRWVPCLDGLQLRWQSYLITVCAAPEQAVMTQVIVPSAQRPLRLQAPSPMICAVMVGLAFVQISSAAKLKEQPLPWNIESLSWDNPHVMERSGRQGQHLPPIKEALELSSPSALERALDTAKLTPAQAHPLKTQSAQEQAQQLPPPALQITVNMGSLSSTPALKRWRPKPPPSPHCITRGCHPSLERGLGARVMGKVRTRAHVMRQCYERSLKRDPTSAGRLKVALTMHRQANSWRVVNTSFTQDERLEQDIGPCVSAKLSGLSVPLHPDDVVVSGEQTLDLVFVFVAK